MFEREARWMLLRFAIMALAAFVLAIVVPPFLGRMTPERCDAEGGIWDAHNGECQRERMGPRALDLERIPDRPPKNPRRLSGMIAIGGGSVIRSRNPENYGNSVRTELAEPTRRGLHFRLVVLFL